MPSSSGIQTVTTSARCRQRFALIQGDAGAPLRDCDVMLAGFNEMVQPWEVRRTAPDFHVVVCTLAGQGWMECGRERWHAEAGECRVLPAGKAHAYGVRQEPWTHFWFHLADHEQWKHLHQAGSDFPRVNAEQSRLQMVLEGYMEETASERASSQQAANAYARLIGHHLCRLLQSENQHPRGWVDDRLDRLWLDVQNALKQDWRIQEMARHVHCSPSHFHRLVLERTGVSPGKLLQRFRMERARELIQHPDYTLDAIADLVGYQSGFALSRAFKAFYGLPPDQHRKQASRR